MTVLGLMALVRDATLEGDPWASRLIDRGAVRLVDGGVSFNKAIFLKMIAEDVAAKAAELEAE